jgi:hypothetical protein
MWEDKRAKKAFYCGGIRHRKNTLSFFDRRRMAPGTVIGPSQDRDGTDNKK